MLYHVSRKINGLSISVWVSCLMWSANMTEHFLNISSHIEQCLYRRPCVHVDVILSWICSLLCEITYITSLCSNWICRQQRKFWSIIVKVMFSVLRQQIDFWSLGLYHTFVTRIALARDWSFVSVFVIWQGMYYYLNVIYLQMECCCNIYRLIAC